jgi:beta-lactamase superfamily II metal-dependent hydrolase
MLTIKSFPDRTDDFTLWQLEQFNGKSQMGYILRTDDNKIIVIDGGTKEISDLLYDYINQLGGTVHYWVLTHPHNDHVGALNQLLLERSNLIIEKVIHAKLDLELVKIHESISYSYIIDFYNTLNNSGIEQLEPEIGDIFNMGEGVEILILGNNNPEIFVNLVNNSSLVFQIKSKFKNVLFTGDLGVEGGNKILHDNDADALQSTHVQMAHHGQDGVTKEFYTAVNAKIALWPTPQWLWDNNIDAKGYNTGPWKTLIVKNWMDELHIGQNIVAGFEGTLQID